MARLQEHYNCPNPVKWGCSPIKTVYIRDTVDGKVIWKPVGRICTGCGVFRSQLTGWFPGGKAKPYCDPWKPGQPGLESVEDSEPQESQPMVELAVDLINNPNLEAKFAREEKAEDLPHGDDDRIPRTRVTAGILEGLLGISRREVLEGIKAGPTIQIPVKRDKHRHWTVPRWWYRQRREARNAKV